MPRKYTRIDEHKAVSVKMLRDTGSSYSDIERALQVPRSTARTTILALEEGVVPGTRGWTLERFNKELEKRSRQAVMQWQDISVTSHTLIAAGLQSLQVQYAEGKPVEVNDLLKLSQLARNSVGIIEAMRPDTQKDDEGQEERELEAMATEDILAKLKKLGSVLEKKVEAMPEAKVIENEPAKEGEGEKQNDLEAATGEDTLPAGESASEEK